MVRLCWLLLLVLALSSSGCATLAGAAGIYALSQTDFVQDQLD